MDEPVVGPRMRTGPMLCRVPVLLVLLLAAAPAGGVRAQTGAVERAGDVLMGALPAGAFAATLAEQDWTGSRQFLLGFATNALATRGLKLAVGRRRPDGSDHESFPSGHTSISFQAASFIHLRYGSEYGAAAYLAAAFVGFSRVHARKHFVSDVVAGAALGVLSTAVFTRRRREARGGGPGAPALGLAVSVRPGGAVRWWVGRVRGEGR